MPTKQVHELELDGVGVKFEHVRAISADGARFDVWTEDCKWQVDVLEGDVQVVASWVDDDLTDLATPDWMDEFAARVRNS